MVLATNPPAAYTIQFLPALLFVFHTPPKSSTHPFGKLVKMSRYAPSGAKLATFHQLVRRFSFGPLFVATAYFTNSRPVLVACTSGVAARWPMMLILAKEERVEVVLKARKVEGE